jgi:hypothetical protein
LPKGFVESVFCKTALSDKENNHTLWRRDDKVWLETATPPVLGKENPIWGSKKFAPARCVFFETISRRIAQHAAIEFLLSGVCNY